MTLMSEKYNSNSIESVESQVMRGSRNSDLERPGAPWDPADGEIYVHSNYYEIGEPEEYGEAQVVYDLAVTRELARLAEGYVLQSETDILPPLSETSFYDRMDELTLASLEAARSGKE